MAGFRDVAVRFYFGLSLAILWDIVHEQVKSVAPGHAIRRRGRTEQGVALYNPRRCADIYGRPLRGEVCVTRETDFIVLLSDPDVLQLMLSACPDGVIATNAEGDIMLYTGASERIFGFEPMDVMHKDIGVLLATPETRDRLWAEFDEHGTVVSMELPAVRKDGHQFAIAMSATSLRDRSGARIASIFYVRDHSAVRAIEDALRSNNSQLNHLVLTLDHVARHDQLTALLRRGSAMEAAEEAILTSGLDRSNFGVALFDLDHFKSVNDSYGHLIGDQVLASVAEILQASARQGDIVGRFGGEEFVAFLPGASLDAVATFAERVRTAVETARIEAAETCIHVTISAGVAAIPSCANSLNEAIRIADDRLYAAKRGGRNRVVCKDRARGGQAA